MTVTIANRIAGCLQGIATGDAIGKQTEMMSRHEVLRWYPNGVRGFEGAPNSVIPRYAGNSKREWRIGETTDDTERTAAVARAIIAEQSISHVSVGQEMLSCTKCVHPGVRSLWEFHQAGDPTRIATAHDGCGAAVRVAPVGIFYGSDCLDELVMGAYEASIPTTRRSSRSLPRLRTLRRVRRRRRVDIQILERAVTAASMAETRWPAGSEFALANALRAVHDDLAALPAFDPPEVAKRCFPNQPLTIVPLALALATLMQSAEDAILVAANVGGDSDSVASIAGGILGARYPNTVNRAWYVVVESVNQHDMLSLARDLAPLRRGCSQPYAAV
jgi:ADP-ribosylglycohydrolase